MNTNQLKNTFSLSDNELSTFWSQGFIAPITVYSPEEMQAIWRAIRVGVVDRTHASYAVDSHGAVTNIANYDRHLDIDLLSDHVTHPAIVGRVCSILGSDVLNWRTEFFPKYPGDEGTDWHQADTFANASGKPQILWPGETEDDFGKGTITVWTAFTDVTIANGCLQVIPGSHLKMNYDETKNMSYKEQSVNQLEKDGMKRGFFGYDYRELQIDPDWKPEEEKAIPLEMKAGQCVIFWSTLMHASYPNSTQNQTRIGFAARYVPATVCVYPNSSEIEEYGGKISLDQFGSVVVAGSNKNPANKIVTQNNRGTTFKKYEFS
jgi:non-heme Fe2+,alpha-ketoglutarate-dependent halogenase